MGTLYYKTDDGKYHDIFESCNAISIVKDLREEDYMTKPESEKRYIVVADGYEFASYGSEMYLLGDFSSREKAEECVKENTIKNPDHAPEDASYDLVPRIIEIDSDTAFPLVKSNYCDDEYRNDYYIGGYIE